MLAGESGYFAAIAANRHGTPAAAARAGIVVEEETTLRIGAEPEARVSSLGNNLGAGAGDSGEQPVQTAFSRDELDFPGAVLAHQLIVPLGNAQDFVDRLDPFPGHSLLSQHGRERLAQGDVEAPGLQEKSFGSLRVDLGQSEKLCTALGGDYVCGVQKVDQMVPGEFGVWRGRIDKVYGESPTE